MRLIHETAGFDRMGHAVRVVLRPLLSSRGCDPTLSNRRGGLFHAAAPASRSTRDG